MFTKLFTSLAVYPLRSLLIPLVGVIMGSAVWFTGCGKSDLPKVLSGNPEQAQATGAVEQKRIPTVAVIDVNEVAEQIGMLKKIEALVKEKELAAQQQFTNLQNQLRLQYQQSAQQLQNSTTGQAQLDALQQQHMQTLNAQWSKLQNKISTFHEEQKSEFLSMVRPMAFAVAKSQGMNMVLTTQQVFSVDEQADITNDVAQKMLQVIANSNSTAGSQVGESEAVGTAVSQAPEATKR